MSTCGRIWSVLTDDEEHVCFRDEPHEGPCICECGVRYDVTTGAAPIEPCAEWMEPCERCDKILLEDEGVSVPPGWSSPDGLPTRLCDDCAGMQYTAVDAEEDAMDRRREADRG